MYAGKPCRCTPAVIHQQKMLQTVDPCSRQLTLLLGLGRVLFTGCVQFRPPLEDQLCSAVPVFVRNVWTCMSGAEVFPLYCAIAFSIIHVELSRGTFTFVYVFPCGMHTQPMIAYLDVNACQPNRLKAPCLFGCDYGISAFQLSYHILQHVSSSALLA